MKKNMGSIDRIIRVALALTFAGIYFSGIVTGTVGIMLLVVGAVFLITSLISSCPIYTVFGLRTCRLEQGRVS